MPRRWLAVAVTPTQPPPALPKKADGTYKLCMKTLLFPVALVAYIFGGLGWCFLGLFRCFVGPLLFCCFWQCKAMNDQAQEERSAAKQSQFARTGKAVEEMRQAGGCAGGMITSWEQAYRWNENQLMMPLFRICNW